MTGEQAPMKRIKVYLSDPQVLFREGIHFILSGEEDIEVIGEATSNEEAFHQIETNLTDIAILSVQDKKVSGPEITRRLKRKFPSIATILTIEQKDDEGLFEIIKSGASACLVKDADPESLLDIIRDAARGNFPIMEELRTPGLAKMVLSEFEDIDALKEQVDNLMAGLTQRETQVLGNIAAGDSLEQVAAKLGIDDEAVRDSLKLILNKMVANDQTRSVIETVQRSLPTALETTARARRLSEEYLTKDEFVKFKESLARRLKNIVGEVV
jgi:DNA-binding NarL/FixJ family response regulator